jgi:hypothetical protein
MMRALRRSFVLLLLSASFAPALGAQDRPIEEFVQQFGRLWIAGDVSGIAALAPGRSPVLIDAGRGMETVQSRHVGAALRSLFSDRETIGVRTVRVTLAGGSPPRGFGELSWSFRPRGAPSSQTRTVYVGASWEDGAWRLAELRLMP